jgi:hypothetical protein
VLRLVKTNRASSGKLDRGDGPPSLFVHFPTLHPSFAERRHFGLEIVTHQVEFVTAILPRMKSRLSGRQSEDQPTVAGVHRGEPQNVSKERAIGSGIFGVYDDMSA